MKKSIAILLTFATLLATAIPAFAATATDICGDNIVWTLNGGTLIISGVAPHASLGETYLFDECFVGTV